MNRIFVIVAAAAVVVAGTAMFGASAFSSAKVSRNPQIQVAADDAGPIALNDGSTGISKLDTGGELQIAVSQLSDVQGLNPDATYTFGNATQINGTTSSPSSEYYVFSITNNGQTSHDVTITFTSDNSLSANNVQFTVLKADGADGNKVTVKVGSSNSETITISKGATWYVVAKFNTGLNGANYVTNSSSLSGTLNITV